MNGDAVVRQSAFIGGRFSIYAPVADGEASGFQTRYWVFESPPGCQNLRHAEEWTSCESHQSRKLACVSARDHRGLNSLLLRQFRQSTPATLGLSPCLNWFEMREHVLKFPRCWSVLRPARLRGGIGFSRC